MAFAAEHQRSEAGALSTFTWEQAIVFHLLFHPVFISSYLIDREEFISCKMQLGGN
jgi:hypothetical protein